MMTDNRTTELLCKLLEERGVKYYDMQNHGIWFGISEDGKDHKFEAFEQINELIEIEVYDLTPEQAIAATLGDDEYESKMDALLCRLTNGKWSKSRSYDLDFMVSCVEEEFEDLYAKELAYATLGNGTLTAEQVAKATYAHSIHTDCADIDWQAIADELNTRAERTCKFVSSKGSDYPPVCSACGYELGIYDCEWFEDGTYGYSGNYCQNCGAKVTKSDQDL